MVPVTTRTASGLIPWRRCQTMRRVPVTTRTASGLILRSQRCRHGRSSNHSNSEWLDLSTRNCMNAQAKPLRSPCKFGDIRIAPIAGGDEFFHASVDVYFKPACYLAATTGRVRTKDRAQA